VGEKCRLGNVHPAMLGEIKTQVRPSMVEVAL